MAGKRMSDKQYDCISWICNTLGIEYDGTTSSYDAWKFISENKPLADKKMAEIKANRKPMIGVDYDISDELIQKNPERAADLFVLHAMSAVGYPKYSCTWDARNKEFTDEFDGINMDDDDIDAICPNGIHCADDIDEFGWMFALRDNPLL